MVLLFQQSGVWGEKHGMIENQLLRWGDKKPRPASMDIFLLPFMQATLLREVLRNQESAAAWVNLQKIPVLAFLRQHHLIDVDDVILGEVYERRPFRPNQVRPKLELVHGALCEMLVGPRAESHFGDSDFDDIWDFDDDFDLDDVPF